MRCLRRPSVPWCACGQFARSTCHFPRPLAPSPRRAYPCTSALDTMAASLMMRTAGRLVCLGTTRARASLSGPPASAAHCRAPARASTLRQARWNGSAARAPPGGGAGTATGEGAEQASKSFADRAVGYWLLGCCGMTAGAVVLGGVTRLTGGLVLRCGTNALLSGIAAIGGAAHLSHPSQSLRQSLASVW